MNQESKILLTIGLASVLIITIGTFVVSRPGRTETSIPVDQTLLVRSDSFHTASDSAKVTLVEFADFQCPACAGAQPSINQLIADYNEKLNYIYRHFPLSQHGNAQIAAEAAEAAGSQDKFFEMSDLLYKNQDEWAESKNPLEKFLNYAKDLNLDLDKFENSINQKLSRDKIKRDLDDANSLGVDSTPTFYLNGVKQNLTSFSQLKTNIDNIFNQN